MVKLPVALSGGSSENTEPEAGAKLATRPSKVWPGSASTAIATGCPACSRETCVSLKLASMYTASSGTRLASRCVGCTKSPTCMARLPTTPSKGARITVKDRSRSTLASEVSN